MQSPEISETPTTFRLGYVPGVTPAKWVGMWKERHRDTPLELVALETLDGAQSVRSGVTHASIVRLPIDRTGLHAIELYREVPVVVFPKDHHFAAADQLSLEDLSSEVVQHSLDDPLVWAEFPGLPAVERIANVKLALEVVAAGVGVIVVPQSLARLHHRKDLTYLPLDGGPDAPVALVWRQGDEDPNIEEFIGIVRGRTVNSSRGTASGSGAGTNQDAPKERQATQKPGAQKTGTKNLGGQKSGGQKSGAKSTARQSSKNASAKYARIQKSRQAAKTKKRGK